MEKTKDIFVLIGKNKNGSKAFLCDLPEGLAFADKMCGQVKIFYSHFEAKRFAKKHGQKGISLSILKMQDLIDDENMAKDAGLLTNPREGGQEMFLIFGVTDDGVKQYVHFDVKLQHYHLKEGYRGACGWYKWQLEDVIPKLEQHDSISIKKLQYESPTDAK